MNRKLLKFIFTLALCCFLCILIGIVFFYITVYLAFCLFNCTEFHKFIPYPILLAGLAVCIGVVLLVSGRIYHRKWSGKTFLLIYCTFILIILGTVAIVKTFQYTGILYKDYQYKPISTAVDGNYTTKVEGKSYGMYIGIFTPLPYPLNGQDSFRITNKKSKLIRNLTLNFATILLDKNGTQIPISLPFGKRVRVLVDHTGNTFSIQLLE